jgi:hypothetical protein
VVLEKDGEDDLGKFVKNKKKYSQGGMKYNFFILCGIKKEG